MRGCLPCRSNRVGYAVHGGQGKMGPGYTNTFAQRIARKRNKNACVTGPDFLLQPKISHHTSLEFPNLA